MTNFVRTFVCNGKTVSRIVVCNAGLILRKILDCTGGDIYGERGARAYNGGLGQSPQRGPGVEPLVRGSPEADSILAFER